MMAYRPTRKLANLAPGARPLELGLLGVGLVGVRSLKLGLLGVGLLVAALLGAGPALAQSSAEDPPGGAATAGGVDTSRWLCRLCPYPQGWFGAVDFGAGQVSDSSLKFGDYRGLEEQGLFPALDGDLHFRHTDGWYFDLYARNLGIDSRQVEMRGGSSGRYQLRLAYREIPKYRGFGAETVFRGAGGSALSLPAGWQPAPTTAGFSQLDGSLLATPLALERRTLDAGATLKFAGKWSYAIDYRHEEKEGERPFGAGVFTIQSSHFPAPVDFTTDQFNMGLSMAGARSHLRIGFTGSEFSNGRDSVTWQNPFSAIPGTETLQAALEPDNEFYQLSLAGAFAPLPDLRLSGRAAWGRMSQDDPFLPYYSINPDFDDLPLPRLSYSGQVDASTLYAAGKLNWQLADALDLTARVKLDERDNDSPVDLYTPVITDLVLRGPQANRPYSFERERYTVELGYRGPSWGRLTAGAESETIERSLQSVARTREHRYWGEFAVQRWARAGLRLRLESSRRDPSEYHQLDNEGLIEHPLQRKFHLADRDRTRAVVELDLTPLDRLGISLAWNGSEDDYTHSFIGLQGSEERSLSLDLNYALSTSTTLYGFATREDIESNMAGALFAGAEPWNGATDDRFVTFGLGFSTRINDRLSLGVDYVSADSEGRIAVDTGAGEAPLPDLRTDLRNARLHLDYRINQQWSCKLYAEHERYDSSDWYLEGLTGESLGPAGIAAILTLGEESPRYHVTVLRVQARYRF